MSGVRPEQAKQAGAGLVDEIKHDIMRASLMGVSAESRSAESGSFGVIDEWIIWGYR